MSPWRCCEMVLVTAEGYESSDNEDEVKKVFIFIMFAFR